MKYKTTYIHTYKVLYSSVLGFVVLYKSTYFNTAYAPPAMLSLSLSLSLSSSQSLSSLVCELQELDHLDPHPQQSHLRSEEERRWREFEGRWPIQDMAEVVVERSAVACACDEAEQALRYKRDRSWVALFFGDFLCGFLFSFFLLPSLPNTAPAHPFFFLPCFPPSGQLASLRVLLVKIFFSPSVM